MFDPSEPPAGPRPADDDPYGGVDVSLMRELLKLTPAERLRWAVESSNNVQRIRDAARRSLRRV